jgi:glycosyltransferase involved in cell wall biosynthesis
VKDYGARPEKVHVIPFGANLDRPPERAEVSLAIGSRAQEWFDFLFVAVDWHRKGGDLALDVVSRLRASGIDARLTIVGCTPPPGVRGLDFLKCKRVIAQAQQLDALYARSHFFIMPSRAEAFGVVFCEAAAWGVPSLGSRVGGIPSAIVDGQTGKVFALDSFVHDCSKYLLSVLGRHGLYEEMAWGAREGYTHRLNWDRATAELSQLMREAV